MKISKPKVAAIPLTIRIAPGLYDQIAAAAARQDWTINAEINHRLRAGPVLEQLQALSIEIATLKAMIRESQLGKAD